MDIKRLQELGGITSPSIVRPVKDSSSNTNASTVKSNNVVPKSMTFDQAHLSNGKSDIPDNVVATLDDTDDSGITVKAGKKDVNGYKEIRKGEDLRYTVSINDAGAPQVDNELTRDLKNVETWGESATYGDVGFIVGSTDNVFVVVENSTKDELTVTFTDMRSKATVVSEQVAIQISEIFENSDIRKLMIAEKEEKDEDTDDEKEDDDEDKAESKPKKKNESEKDEDLSSKKEEKSKKDSDKDADDECTCIKESLNENTQSPEEYAKSLFRLLKLMLRRNEIIPVHLVTDGKPFDGTISSITPNVLMVKPEARTVKMFGLQGSDPQAIKYDPSQLRWNDDTNSVEGVVGPLNKVDPVVPGQQVNRNPGMFHVPTKPSQGEFNKPSTWQLDMSSAKPAAGASLMERMQFLRKNK